MNEHDLRDRVRDAFVLPPTADASADGLLALATRRHARRLLLVRLTAAAAILFTIGAALAYRHRGAPRTAVGPTHPNATATSYPPPGTPTSTSSTSQASGWAVSSPAPTGAATGARLVWTGTEMLAVGGIDAAGSGLAYDPAVDRWNELPAAPQPFYQVIQWTGQELVALLGQAASGAPVTVAGAAYQPASRTWRPLPAVPLTPRSHPVSAWTGTDVIVWGGSAERCLDDGAAYNPTTETWRPLARSPLVARCDSAVSVWTGTELLIWGGSDRTSERSDGAAYNPTTDTWRTISPSPLKDAAIPDSVWTGAEMLVAVDGAAGSDGVATEVAGYDPVADTWRRLPQPPANISGASLTWTGTQLLVVGNTCTPNRGGEPTRRDVAFTPQTDTWATLHDPAGRTPACGSRAVWTGTQLIAWGPGEAGAPAADTRAVLYRP